MKLARALFITIPVAFFILLPCYAIGGFAGLVWIALGAGWDLGLGFFDKLFSEVQAMAEKKND